MSEYIWRKNFTAEFANQDKKVRGKLAIKTRETHWIDTEKPVIVLVSIHSAIHGQIDGDLKMNALVSTIKSHVRGKITVLLSDSAHLQVASLDFHNNVKEAFQESLKSAHAINYRYKNYFEGCNVAYWHSYISQDEYFTSSLNFLRHMQANDFIFQSRLKQDAEASYTPERMQKFPNKTLFMEKTIEDILEQCVCILVLAEKGYRFQFYPGCPCASTEYINRVFLPQNKQVTWIDVFLSIEKKIYLTK